MDEALKRDFLEARNHYWTSVMVDNEDEIKLLFGKTLLCDKENVVWKFTDDEDNFKSMKVCSISRNGIYCPNGHYYCKSPLTFEELQIRNESEFVYTSETKSGNRTIVTKTWFKRTVSYTLTALERNIFHPLHPSFVVAYFKDRYQSFRFWGICNSPYNNTLVFIVK